MATSVLESDQFIGLSPVSEIPVTLRSTGDQPLILGNDVRGTIHALIDSGDRITNISGRRIEEGMIVYVKVGYTVTDGGETFTYEDDTYYTYREHSSDTGRDLVGALPNNNRNWIKLEDELSIATDSELNTRITDEEMARLRGDSELGSRIDSEVARIDSEANTETIRVNTEIARLDSELDTEEAARIADIARVDSEANTETARVNTEIARLDSELDTEEAARIADVARLDSEIARLDSELDTEELARMSDIARVDSEADTETTRVNAEIARLDSELDTEVIDRAREDSELETRLTNEIARLDSELDTEIVDRAREDSELETRLTNADTGLGRRIDNEIVARSTADSDLSTRITGNTSLITTLNANLVSTIERVRNESDANIRAIRERRIPELPTDFARDLRYDPTTSTFSWEQPFQLTVNTIDGHLEAGEGIDFALNNADPSDSESEIIISVDRDYLHQVIDSEIIVDSESVRHRRSGITFSRYTDSEARAAVGVTRNVQDDILGNSPLIFETDDNLRRLVEYRESDGTGGNVVSRIRTARFVDDGSNQVFTLTLVTLTPNFRTRSIGENQLFWDIPATGSAFSDPVGIEVTVRGDTELTGADDPFISGIRSVHDVTGGSLTFNLLNRVTIGTPSSTAVDYTFRAVVDDDSYFRPSTTAADGTDGGSISGSVSFNQNDGSGNIVPYTGIIDDSEWTITWQDVSTRVSTSGYTQSSTGMTFLKAYTFTAVAYTNDQNGLSPTSTALQSVAAQLVNVPGTYATIINPNNAGGSVQFAGPIHKNNARDVVIESTTTLNRDSEVTGSPYSITDVASATLPAPTFNYPGFYIRTDVGRAPIVADIINDGSPSGFSASVTLIDNGVDGWDGTGSTGMETINIPGTSAQVVWFGVRLGGGVTQPTTFQVDNGFGMFIDQVPDTITVSLRPDDISSLTGYVAQDYRLYGLQLNIGDTNVRIF